MQNTKDQTQVQQAITLLKTLLEKNDAIGIREDLNKIFYGYISSEFSDCQQERNYKYGTYLNLVEFLTKLSKLKKINCWSD
tara:strand:- start:7 stop:249 length:243 start_codon:yes stop_codon:yes gene_type:complete